MDKVDKSLAVALGAGVTTNPMQMAQAYGTFANGGVMNDAHLITKIENAEWSKWSRATARNQPEC